MHFIFLQQLLSDQILQAICWTLIHSLWQGLLLAAVCGAVIILTRKSSSALRYNLLSVLFFLFLLVAAFTFTREFNLAARNDSGFTGSLSGELAGVNTETHHANISSLVTSSQDYIEKISSYLSTHASLVVTIWFIIFSARCVKLLADLGYAHRIRYYKTHEPSPYWKAKMLELSNMLQIKKHIVLLESEIVKVPVMTGFLKPVVLFPFSMITQLPAEQVEAVLLHELAHIMRRDYVVNLAQSFAETIFFFNPAVVWISSLIREERENCCDDIVIHHTKNKKQFIHALVAFQEYNIDNTGYALAFPGKKNQLLQRVKRILQNDNKTLNIMQKVFLTSALVIAGLLTVVFAQNSKHPRTVPAKPAAVAGKPIAIAPIENIISDAPTEIVGVPESPDAIAGPVDAVPPIAGIGGIRKISKSDTLPIASEDDESFRGIIDRAVDGRRYEIVIMHGKVTELYVDNKRIPDEKMAAYKNTVDKIIKETREQSAKAKKDAEGDKVQAHAAKLEAETAQREAQSAKLSAQDAKRESDVARVSAQQSLAESKESMEQAQLAKIEAEGAKEKSERDKLLSEKMLGAIITDLKNDALVKDENNLSFTLNKDEFIVNGTKQPASLRAKYVDKYTGNGKTRIKYSKSGSSSHISFQENK